MSKELTGNDLLSIPLFDGLNEDTLDKLARLFEPVTVQPGAVIFEIGDPAVVMYLLQEGEVVLTQKSESVHHLHPPVLIGEVGALTGSHRITSAIAADGAQLFEVRGAALRQFFASHPEAGVRAHQNLLDMCDEKMLRDQRRLNDMRDNIIRTQKSMKEVRDFLLESQDTVVSRPVHEILERLIERNRRVNYTVEPTPSLTSVLKLDDDHTRSVMEISRTGIVFERSGLDVEDGDYVSGVLTLGDDEIAISGKVLEQTEHTVAVELNLLIEDYISTLESYLTRVQMLDVLV